MSAQHPSTDSGDRHAGFPLKVIGWHRGLGPLLACCTVLTAGASEQVDRPGGAVTNANGGPDLPSVVAVEGALGSCATPASGSGLNCTLYLPAFPSNTYVTGINPVTYNVSPFQDQYPLDVTLQGSATAGGATAQYLTLGSLGQSAGSYPATSGGTQFVPAQGQQNGSSITLTNQAALTIDIQTPSALALTTNPAGGPALAGGGVLAAASVGPDGYPADETVQADFNGGDGGTVTIINAGQLEVQNNSESGVAPPPAGAAYTPMAYTGIGAYSIGGMGVGNKTHDDDMAGDGGDGGTVSITIDAGGSIGMDVGSNAYPTYGLNALSQGGQGQSWHITNAMGGDGGSVQIDHQGQIELSGSATEVVGIRAISLGADYNAYSYSSGDHSAGAGNGGAVEVTLTGGSIMLSNGGLGILATSAAGNAEPGLGGAGGAVSIDLDADSSISVNGGTSLSLGALAISAGALSDIDPFSVNTANAVAPGTPGQVTLKSAGEVTTTGSMGIGLAALSVGGASFLTNADANAQNTLGNVGTLTNDDQVSGQAVTLTNTGSVQTSGDSAFGLLALSGGGGGGLLNQDSDGQSAYLGSQATADSPGGNGAEVNLTHGGSVTTGAASGGGDAAIGIVAQSIGGGGGSSNAPPVFVGAKDADGSGGGSGGTVNVSTTSGSTVTTYGHNAQGILAQSIGGGGGNGANAWGLVAALGGQGGNGGDGGEVNVTLSDDGSGAITTAGLFSKAVHAQSIGGGGGNGGSATSFYQLASVAIGGAGGSGGDGGAIDITNQTRLRTSGNQAIGLLAHSIGGGGGDGGAASTYDVGIITLAIAVGGNAGNGGDGGSLSIENDGIIQTGCITSASGCGYGPTIGPQLDGADAVGILAQSIGGGGGTGGSAAAKSLGLPADDIPTITADFAIGGSGGDGGSGQAISVSNAGQIQSAGDVSYGVLAQSIGGGGGSGGDATAASYAIEGEMPTIKLAVSLGGSGGGAGGGGTVTVGNGPTTNCPGCDGGIQTHGQHATGVLAQSIGGGGGTGGTGSSSASSPNLGDDTDTAIDVTTGVGGSGGDGGDGGSVTLTNAASSRIITTGSTARGLHAQSIGGGGGDASGGSAAASGDTLQINLAVGGKGGYGGDGGGVSITNAGSIATGATQTNSAGQTVVTGGDAVGILAQSIGGGGGSGGSADPAASIGKAGQVEDWLNPPDNSYNANVGVGGSGGVSGNGGVVSLTNASGATLTTLGTRAHGILAHSIGGGGGSGGAATSSSNAVFLGPTTDDEGNAKAGTYTATVSVGGGGGSAGDGGQVGIANPGTIQTAGYGAYAILAQSIGGGGGYGAEGTVDNSSTIGLGAGWDGNGGAGGDGGSVNITQSGQGLTWTAGDDAFGILAQSIGGGGGSASAGCTNSVASVDLGNSASLCLGNNDPSTIWDDSSDLSISIGGTLGAYGDGDTVTVTLQDSSQVLTTGARAVGILAQSIGGGGGQVSALYESYEHGLGWLAPSSGQISGNGGDIDISLDSGASVTTYGDGAWGIVAQSIGGSGGLLGDLSQALDASALWANGGPTASGTQDANAGDLSISIDGQVVTQGDNAHGVVAQSIAGGGGIAPGEYVGQAAFAESDYPDGATPHWGVNGAIDISVGAGGVVKATGTGSHGILAQASTGGDYTNTAPITVSVAGTVTGGHNGWGILVAGGSMGIAASTGNTVTIASGGVVGNVDGIDGGAIQSVLGRTNITIEAGGTLSGTVDLGSQSAPGSAAPDLNGMINNSGIFNAGSSLSHVQNLTNASGGQFSIGGDGTVATTTLTNLVQTASDDVSQTALFSNQGDWHVDIDALGDQTADLMQVYGQLVIDGGTIVPLANSLLPGPYLIGQVMGGDGTPAINGAPGFADSLLFEWALNVDGANLTLVPTANFQGGSGLIKGSDGAVASHLSSHWNAMSSASTSEQQTWAPVFGTLAGINNSTDYSNLLAQLSSQNIAADASDLAASARAGLSASLSCPGFAGDGTLLTEGTCTWASVIGEDIHRDGDAHSPEYDIRSSGLRIGGQYGLGNGWFLGASGAYRETTTEMHDIASRSNGEAFDFSLALKKQWERWLFAAALNLSKQWSDNRRWFQWHNEQAELTSSSDATVIAGRLRAAYTLPLEGWYLRPYLDLDMVQSDSPSFRESGDNWYGLIIESSSKTTLAMSPMLEAGARIDLQDDWIVRLYLRGGMTWLDDPSWQREARFIGGPASAGSFTTERRLPRRVGTIDFGVQVYQNEGFEARLEYGMQSGDGYLAHSGGLRFAYRF
ncbi:autotransporter outer membrane beta-barrel domain-containing protein [Thiorhodococcus mannitoliphagus]|uniref:Autotransporter outer membrane beta-barrel domain-containing protein n=1 Tax=Thiorhodococcus mannitoliphagus TaxID=329406 RepID=A0A6P1DX12_9GAMM|nr:autotransporter outer membrane beta-barrel domain-containing protein [Thiorhodococcus mannitoliphagus]NEX21256.1 autotransporter outer membrane beta-barrel domain-containing protein [Thiorhodococcus mannitoliphagus]